MVLLERLMLLMQLGLALENCAPFIKCNLKINDEHVDTAENLDIVMPMYNLIEYSDNYQHSSTSLYQYKRDEPPEADAVADLTANNSDSLNYKIKLLGNVTEVAGNAAGVRRLNVKAVVPLKYLSNFFRSFQILGKAKLDTVKVLVSKALINLYINHDKLVSVNNVLREYNNMKEEIKASQHACEIYYIKTMEKYSVSYRDITGNEDSSVRKTKQNRLMLLSNCVVCGKKKSSFIKNHSSYLTVLVDRLLNIVKEFKNLEKQFI